MAARAGPVKDYKPKHRARRRPGRRGPGDRHAPREARDPRVAWFVLRQGAVGHDPAAALARGGAAVVARPYEEEPAQPPPSPPARGAAAPALR